MVQVLLSGHELSHDLRPLKTCPSFGQCSESSSTRWRSSRKYCNRFNLEERPLPRQPRNGDGRTGWSVAVWQIAVAHLAEDWQIFDVEEVVVEFDDVLELRTDRCQGGF